MKASARLPPKAAVVLLFMLASCPPGARAAVPLLDPSAQHPLCRTCRCDRSMVPVLVNCSAKDLKLAFGSDADEWEMDQKEARQVSLDLDFSNNEIESVTRFPELNVHSLNLAHNVLTSVDDDAFADLNFLNFLDLSFNDLDADAVSETAFRGRYNRTAGRYDPLPVLELDLGYNELEHLDRTSFVHLSLLQVLVLDGNAIRSIDEGTATALASLPDLRSLSMVHCSIRKLSDGFLASVANLQRLDLSHNFFTEIHEDLQHANRLVELNLNGNAFKDFKRETFHGLESVKVLHACEMRRLKRVGEGAFTGMPNLETLYLQDNPELKYIHPDAFEDIPAEDFRLRKLYLANNKLKYLPQELVPDPYSNWEDLEVMDLERNPWMCDCHNEWFTGDLVAQVAERNPELVDGIICGGPGDLKGQPVATLKWEPGEKIPCPKKDLFNPYRESFGVSLRPKYKNKRLRELNEKREKERKAAESGEEEDEDESDRLAVGVAITCFVVVGIAACCIAGLYLQRKRVQRYRTLNRNLSFGIEPDAGVGGGGGGGSDARYRDTGELGDNHDDIVRRMGGAGGI